MATPPAVTTVRVTPEMLDAEAARQAELDAGNGIEDALDTGTGEGDAPAREPTVEDLVPRGKPIQRSPADDARLAIAARFKRGNEVPFNGDLTDPEMIYGEAGRQPSLEPEPDPSIVGEVLEPEPEPVAQPATRKLKIRGQDVELTDDQILEAARKTLAADTYLEDARKLLEEAKTIKAERAGRDPQPPEGRTDTQDDGLDSDDQQNRTRPPAPDFKSVVEKIQYGDPEEAARDLETIVSDRVGKGVSEGHLTRLFDNDLAKSQQALKAFKVANPDLAADEIAQVVIERSMYAGYKEDIQKIGIDEAQIPTDPVALANWHRFYRINGYEVRSTADLLAKAKEKVVGWRGAAAPKPAARPAAPRVAVNVDRTERRMAIPNQPTRAAVPRRDVQPAPQKTPGSDVVAEMRRARGQIT